MMRAIALREEGDGDGLAEGSARWAAAAGRPDLSMSVKGLVLAAYDARGAYGMALRGEDYRAILRHYYRDARLSHAAGG
jgi:aldehyde:ferredoxin oxidoreductase